MKNNMIFSFLVAMLALGFSTTSFAQYDDLYYNPADDKITTSKYNTDVTDESFDNAPASDENATYGEDDSFYNYDDAKSETRDRSNSDFRGDDYGYEYSSRIRRFNTPYPGFGFYDPIYVDVAYYDPFYTPGTNIYIFSGYNRYDRFGRNNFVPSSFYYNNSYGSSYYNPYASNNPYSGAYNPYNNGFNNNFSSNNYYGSSYGGGYNPYCPPTGGYGSYSNNNNTNSNSNNNGYRGARRNGEGTATGGSTSGRGQVDPLKSNDGEKKVNTAARKVAVPPAVLLQVGLQAEVLTRQQQDPAAVAAADPPVFPLVLLPEAAVVHLPNHLPLVLLPEREGEGSKKDFKQKI
jgi:hypothetical protein